LLSWLVLTETVLYRPPDAWQVAEKHLLFRLLKNVQMQGARNFEE
jgi:hypothetical protein